MKLRASLFAALYMLLIHIPSTGQELTVESTAPENDSLFIKEVRAHLDYIRKTESRPTVALVLSGGGAKGAAQVGVLKYLEEIEMPIDFICGTSIGGLISGLYSLGYDSAYIRNLFVTGDWDSLLSDKIDPKYISYAKKRYSEKYLITIPFHYAKRDLHLAADKEALLSQKGMRRLTSSLPSGLAYGFNVNNLLTSMSVGYHDSQSFANLPIPYMCVASDVISYKANNWVDGPIVTALRSTMSIPGLFDPVRYKGMVLVDGGTRNNFPADFAKAVGADYIIGIDLANEDPGFNEVQNIGNIVGQFISMLGSAAYEKNKTIPDVRICPNVDGYNMLSFNPEAVDSLLMRGYDESLKHSKELLAILDHTGEIRNLPKTNTIDISTRKVAISSVEFEGLNNYESRLLMKRIKFKGVKEVDKAIMDNAMSILQATGIFEKVSYSLLGEQEPFALKFHCEKGPVNQLGLGLRMDTEQWASVAMTLGFNARKLSGLKFTLDGTLGVSQNAEAKFIIDLPYLPTLNLSGDFSNTNCNVYVRGSSTSQNMNVQSSTQKVYFSDMTFKKFNFQAGIRNTYYDMSKKTSFGYQYSLGFPDDMYGNVAGAFAVARIYSLDNTAFPKKGTHFCIKANYEFPVIDRELGAPIYSASLDWKLPISVGQRFAIIPDLHFRTVFNSQKFFYNYNFVGGDFGGRYVDHQIPFSGFGDIYYAKDNVAVLNMEARVQIGENFYLGAKGSYLREEDTLKDMLTTYSPDHWGTAFELAYDSIMGPIKFDLRWSDMTQWGFFLSLGYDF